MVWMTLEVIMGDSFVLKVQNVVTAASCRLARALPFLDCLT